MDEQLNHAPCGFMTISEEGLILSINQTLCKVLEYNQDQLCSKHINTILTAPARLFFQLYFFPLISVEKKVEEMYLSLKTFNGEEVPILTNAIPRQFEGKSVIECIIIPMHKRNEYENELLVAKKEAETALVAMNKTNAELEVALDILKRKQDELLDLNKQNQKYKTDTKIELELARIIQEKSLTEPINDKNVQMETFYKASSELSGDIYGCYLIEPHLYGIIILDVMGHGISSSLITMSLHSLFQRLISKGSTTDVVMGELDNHLHTLFYNNEENRHYCTAISLVIDTDKQVIEYINAGHPPALWQDPNGEQVELHSTFPPIGAFEDISFNSTKFNYTKGGRLLLYTDGVTDPLGNNHLCSLLMENPSVPLVEFKEIIIESLKDDENVFHKSDDQCFIIIDLK
jgi:sigma-B regulation protein RsbU (phosphoserine phosphatase)